MRSRLLIFHLIIFMILFSGCKNEEKTDAQNKESQPEEIAQLTQTANLKDYVLETDTTEVYESGEVLEFYRENDFQPVWNDQEIRAELFGFISQIDSEGLFPEDYHYLQIEALLNSLNQNSEKNNTRLEILLTDASLKLIRHLASGKLNPAEIHEIWGLPLNEVQPKTVLKNAISQDRLAKTFESLSPDNPVYQGLKKALKEYDLSEFETDSTTQIRPGKLIRPGESSDRLAEVGKRLTELGLYKGSIDTIYTHKLELAVKQFQKESGLQVDGLLGNSTITNMNMNRKDRYQQILINMERWRWYPRDLGDHYIIINIPDYRLSVIKDKDTISNHKIMVGTRSRQTPVFSDEIEYIVYNPTWTIPPTIKSKDVIPGVRRDSTYLSSRNIQVYDQNGQLVEPKEIDWSSSQARTYTYRQRSGGSNPLGRVKIIYPNKYMIYLHDTPSQALFERNTRAQSSGCVRVQNALDLAKYLLNDQEVYTSEAIEEILASGKTKEIPVKQDVAVYHLYWTATLENGNLRFIDDIYNLDKPLWQKFKPDND
ncbi:hypothetical protein E0K83_00795 [Gramella sp. BOM4]|nr:hypothetical protein [Christiangramia bathymodioli]